MDHSLLVSRLQRLSNLVREGECPFDAQRAALEDRCEIFAWDEFHGDEPLAVRPFVETIDGGNVGVVQRREKFCLTLESRQSIRVFGERLRQHLDRHLAIEGCVGGRPDNTHPALAELVDEPVVEKSCTLI